VIQYNKYKYNCTPTYTHTYLLQYANCLYCLLILCRLISKYKKNLQLFDMKKFQSNVNRELRRAYPDRRRLETQCLSAVAFVKSENDILECPIWVLIVNVVAMDMLKSKLPPGELQVCLNTSPFAIMLCSRDGRDLS